MITIGNVPRDELVPGNDTDPHGDMILANGDVRRGELTSVSGTDLNDDTLLTVGGVPDEGRTLVGVTFVGGFSTTAGVRNVGLRRNRPRNRDRLDPPWC